MGKYYLARYCTNYADEFDIKGFVAFTENEYKEFQTSQQKLKSLEEEGKFDITDYEVGFGTNEYLTFDSVDEVINAIEVQPITEQEYNTLSNLNLTSFGELTLFDFFYNAYEDVMYEMNENEIDI